MPDFRKTVRKSEGGETTNTIDVDSRREFKIEQSSDGQTAITVAPEAKSPLPDTMTIGTLGVVTAVVVWGALEVLKILLRGWKKKTQGKTPWFWAASLRLLALVLGGAAGTILYGSLGGVGKGWPWGTAIGVGAGALCTLIVGMVKVRIKGIV